MITRIFKELFQKCLKTTDYKRQYGDETDTHHDARAIPFFSFFLHDGRRRLIHTASSALRCVCWMGVSTVDDIISTIFTASLLEKEKREVDRGHEKNIVREFALLHVPGMWAPDWGATLE